MDDAVVYLHASSDEEESMAVLIFACRQGSFETAFADHVDSVTGVIAYPGGGEEEPGSGPARLITDTWAWNGQAFTLRSREFEPPVFRFQAARDGDAATARGDYDRALAFYQQAVFDEKLLGWNPERLAVDSYDTSLGTPTPSPDPEERPRLNAYGRYRILLIHAILGNRDAAETVYGTLKQKIPPGSPGFPYVALADAFWESLQSTGRVASACENARSYAAEHEEEVLAPLGSSVYGFLYEDYSPSDICPFD